MAPDALITLALAGFAFWTCLAIVWRALAERKRRSKLKVKVLREPAAQRAAPPNGCAARAARSHRAPPSCAPGARDFQSFEPPAPGAQGARGPAPGERAVRRRLQRRTPRRARPRGSNGCTPAAARPSMRSARPP
jgi:hypothetical protein